MTENYLTLKQLIDLVDIPENSCKRYMQEHEEYLNYKKVHNRYMIHVSAVETLKIIRRLYGEGLKKEAVDEHLKGAGIPVTFTVDSEEAGTALISVNEEIAALKKMMELQMQFSQKLVQQMEANQLELKDSFHREIQELKTIVNRQETEKVTALRLSLEDSKKTVQEATEQADAEKNRSWFSKLFGKKN